MITPRFQAELVELVGELSAIQQRQVLDFARSLHTSASLPPSASRCELQQFWGRMNADDTRLMQEAIADCERIDSHGW